MPNSKDSQPGAPAPKRKRIHLATYQVDLRALAEALLEHFESTQTDVPFGDVEH